MIDLLLTRNGDLYVTDNGDVKITNSVSQAIKIRLKWFLSEWKFNPDFGVPYYEEILIKNPSKLQTEQLIREQITSVDEVEEIKELEIEVSSLTRIMRVSFTALAAGEVLREEMMFDV